jgi:hypothetical protein
VIDVPDPSPWAGELLVEGIAVGVCGTDKEIARGDYGWAPPGQERLVLVHESFGRGREGPEGSGFSTGVRHGRVRDHGAHRGVVGGRHLPGRPRPAQPQHLLESDVVVGSVNANLRHYALAADALAAADLGWLGRLITRRVPLADFADALEAEEHDVKVVLDLAG